MAQLFPDESPDLWDKVYFPDVTSVYMDGKRFSPELYCDYDGSRTSTVDSQLIVSGIGAIPGNLRRNPAKFSFTMKVWLPEHMEIYEKVLAFVLDRGNALKTFRVEHPALAQLDVRELFLESVTPLRRSSAREPLTSRWSTTEKLPLTFIAPQTVEALSDKAKTLKDDRDAKKKKTQDATKKTT